jgi:hypothetical protein
MSFTLFDLLPALYRLRDAQIAGSQDLLTTKEKAQLEALQKLETLTPDEAMLLSELTDKASRNFRAPGWSLSSRSGMRRQRIWLATWFVVA